MNLSPRPRICRSIRPMCRFGFALLCLQTWAIFGAEAADVSRSSPAQTSGAETARARLKALPPPLQSASGKLFVSAQSAERAALRWPIMRFAETVADHLSDTFLPLGSATSPLAIEIGTATNAVSGIERRIFSTGDGFAQLVIRIPNPESVDLDVLREAVAEALLREKTREHTGSYAAYSWPKWWLRALVDASKGNVWKAESFERLQAEIRQGSTPTLAHLLGNDAQVSREAAMFFALWLLEDAPYQRPEQRIALLTTPWSNAKLLETLDESAWQTWLKAQESVIFLPGTLTYSQFLRWKESLIVPQTNAEALKQTQAISRAMIGRPRPFCDLCDLYFRAYTAYLNGGIEAYRPLRREADEAAAFLEQHLERTGRLTIEETL